MDINKFYTPYKDETGKVYLMRYTNNGYSYGLSNPSEQKYYLCKSPIGEAIILSIISEHESFSEMQEALFKHKKENISY